MQTAFIARPAWPPARSVPAGMHCVHNAHVPHKCPPDNLVHPHMVSGRARVQLVEVWCRWQPRRVGQAEGHISNSAVQLAASCPDTSGTSAVGLLGEQTTRPLKEWSEAYHWMTCTINCGDDQVANVCSTGGAGLISASRGVESHVRRTGLRTELACRTTRPACSSWTSCCPLQKTRLLCLAFSSSLSSTPPLHVVELVHQEHVQTLMAGN